MDQDYAVFLSSRIKKLEATEVKFIRLENFVEDVLSLDFVKDNYDSLKYEIENNLIKNQYANEYAQEGLNKKYWKDYYTTETAELIQKKMKDEFDYFKYDLNSWI